MKKTKIKSNADKGRGVFADEFIKKGELIENSELLVLDFAEVGPFLERYVFTFNKTKAAVALGNGSLYNHSDKPNAVCYLDSRKKILSFEAKKNINPGEEITINYGYSLADRKKFNIH
jgi:SET domain-containing protein